MKSFRVRIRLSAIAVLLSSVFCFGSLTAEPVAFLTAKNLERIADLDFDTLGTRDGLPHQSIYGFTQDTTGYIWIASYGGLSRFDGYRIRSYVHDAAVPGSLRDNNVRWVMPAANGNLWLGSDNAGVFFYRAATDSFEAIPDLPREFATARIYAMTGDGQDGIWVGGQFGLAHIDSGRKTREFFPARKSKSAAKAGGLPLKRVFAIYLDSKGVLWTGGDPGVAILRPGAKEFETVGGVEGPDEVGPEPSVWSFLEDKSGRLWVGCDHVGLATYDREHRVLRGVPGLSGERSEIGEHTVRGMIEHAPGELWIATYGGGLVTYNSVDGYIRSFVKVTTKPYPLRNNFLRCIFRDRSGVVWLATDNGAAKLNHATTGIYQIHPTLENQNRFSGTEIRSVGEAQGAVWVGFDQGEFGTIGPDAQVRRIPLVPGVPEDMISRREITAIKEFDHDTLYAAGTGIFRVDLKTMTYRPVSDPLISGEVASSLATDGPRMWAGTYNGLYEFEPATGKSTMYHHDPADAASISENDIRDLLRTRDGRLWVGTRSGLNLREPGADAFRTFRHAGDDPSSLPNDNIRSLAEDRTGRLWIATNGTGVALLDHWSPAGKPCFKVLSTRTGLPSDAVFTLTVGADGRVWANTADGLAVIDPDTLKVQRYNSADGLRSAAQKLFGSVTLDDGTLLFRGPDGLIAVQPDHLGQSVYRAPLVISSLTLTGDTGSATVKAEQAMATGTIRLNPRHRGFEAEIALLDYTGPESTVYSYQLTGYDARWIELPAGTRVVDYEDLPPGNYDLHMRAVSRSGRGPVIESTYRIAAPRVWIERFWARGLIVLAIAALIFLLIQARTAVLSHRREQLEEEISERTLELNEKGELLEKANLMLGQLAIRDPLTNLYNRRHFLDLAEIELIRSRRSGRAMALLLMDIDHFKNVNDTYGHLAGDEVIRVVAMRIGVVLRGTDTLARFGGEEYVVLLPETDMNQASLLAERVRISVASTPIKLTEGQIHVTISIGCAQADAHSNLTQLIERTDKALYRAKLERNRVQTA